MENQKIQQLIRLASIADKNGDYKIADKIFEKLAATPPPLKVPPRFNEPQIGVSPGSVYKPRNLEQFLTSVASRIEKFVAEETRLKSLIAQYEKLKDISVAISTVHTPIAPIDPKAPKTPVVPGAPVTAKKFISMTDQDLTDALAAYKLKKKLLDFTEQELENELRNTTKDQDKINSLRTEISNLQKFINDSKYREIFGDDPANPKNTIPYTVLLEQLKNVKDEINRELPDPNQIQALSVAFRNESNAMGRLTAFFNKIDTKKANDILDKFKLEEDLEGKKWWTKFWARRGKGWDKFVRRFSIIKDTFIQIGAERKASSDFNDRNKLSPAAIKAYFGHFYKQESQDFSATFTNLINALDKELVYEFIKQKNKYRLDQKLSRPLTDKEIDAITEAVRIEVAKGTVGALVTGLFEAMTKNFKVLKEAAKSQLPEEGLTSPRILAKMIRLDGKFMKNTGISPAFAYKLIENENLSIEDFLKSQGNPVIANIKNEKRNAILAVLTISGGTYLFVLKPYLNKKAKEKELKDRENKDYLTQLRGTSPGSKDTYDQDVQDLLKP
jgi:hypothetical protein